MAVTYSCACLTRVYEYVFPVLTNPSFIKTASLFFSDRARRPARWIVWSGAFIVIAGATFSIWLAKNSPSRVSILPLVIARLEVPYSGLLYIAEVRGYFKDMGLAVTTHVVPTGYDAIRAITAGDATVGTAAETPIARALDEGMAIKVVASIFNSRTNSGIVARRDKGIARIGDLKHKRIGFVFGTSTHYRLETFLVFNGVPLDQVVLVPLKASELVSAVTSGAVDAVACWNPILAEVRRRLGNEALMFSKEDFYTETNNLIVTRAGARQHGEEITRLLRALAKAEDFIQANPGKSSNILAARSGADPRSEDILFDPLDYELALSQSLVLAMEDEAHWFVRRGLVSTVHAPNVLEAIDLNYLERIKPSAISIIK